MSVLTYCTKVQDHVKASKPDAKIHHELYMEWFGDTGRASRAVTAALEGKNSEALRLAEPLAERYNLP